MPPADAPALSVLAGLVYGQEPARGGLRALSPRGLRRHPQRGAHRSLRDDAQVLDRAAEAVAFLRERVARLGDRSSAPARSLFRGLEDLGRIDEGLEALEARAAAPSGATATCCCSRPRRRAATAGSRGRRSCSPRRPGAPARATGGGPRRASPAAPADLRASLDAWTAVAAAEPLALDAHRVRAELLLRLEGRPQAVEHVTAAAARVPTHLGLQRLLVEWLRDDAAARGQALRTLLQRHLDRRLVPPRALARARGAGALRRGARGARARRRARARAARDTRRTRPGAGPARAAAPKRRSASGRRSSARSTTAPRWRD